MLAVVVVLPTPPLPEVMTTTRGVGPVSWGLRLYWRAEWIWEEGCLGFGGCLGMGFRCGKWVGFGRKRSDVIAGGCKEVSDGDGVLS